MEFNTLTRYLIHGIHINLNNLHELLYFDALTCSDKKLIVVNNIWDNKVVDRLVEKNMIVDRQMLLSETDSELLTHQLQIKGKSELIRK